MELADDRPRLRRYGAQVRRALPVDRRGDGPTWASDTGMWDEEDGFFYDVLRLPDGRRQRLKVRSMVGLLPLCAATVFEAETPQEVPEIAGSACMVPRRAARSCWPLSTTRPSRATAAGAWARSWTRTSCAACWRRCWTKTSSSARTASARSPATTPTTLSSSMSGARNTGRIPAGGVRHRHVRRQLQLARADLDARQRSDHRALLTYYPYYGNDFKVECPTGSGQHDEPVRGRRGDQTPARQHLPKG